MGSVDYMKHRINYVKGRGSPRSTCGGPFVPFMYFVLVVFLRMLSMESGSQIIPVYVLRRKKEKYVQN